MLLSPPKNQWEPNLQHENSDAPSPSAGYNNHIALLGNRLAGEVDGKTIGCRLGHCRPPSSVISHFNTKRATGCLPRTWPSA